VFIFEKFKKVTIGEVVPAREGLRLLGEQEPIFFAESEKWFQQEKD